MALYLHVPICLQDVAFGQWDRLVFIPYMKFKCVPLYAAELLNANLLSKYELCGGICCDSLLNRSYLLNSVEM